MTWYNPLTWGGEGARYIADEFFDAIGAALAGAAEKIKENPAVVVAPVAAVVAAVTVYNAAKTAGQEGGKKVVKIITKEGNENE